VKGDDVALCGLCSSRFGVPRVTGAAEPAPCSCCGDETRCRIDQRPAKVGPPAPQPPLPGEVAIAFTSNNCARCGRQVQVNEPIYRHGPAGFRCAGCNDALEGRGDHTIPFTNPREAITSVLLRRAAQLLDADSWDARDCTIIAHELRQRAELLQRVLAENLFDCGICERRHSQEWSCRTYADHVVPLMRAIGEVRS
jgi:hypothetical protein